MSVYKLFPTKDTTLYSRYPSQNTGLDEILEVSSQYTTDGAQVSRALLQFSQPEILDVINNKISTSSFAVNFKLINAYTVGLIDTSTIELYPVSSSWTMGSGHSGDILQTQNGASWSTPQYSGSSNWASSSFNINTTASFPSSNPGGGDYYYNYGVSQSFNYYSSKDINVDLTTITTVWYSGSIDNNGLILKLPNSQEFIADINYQPIFTFYSRDTHTIYPPELEFKWDDSVYNTGSLSVLSTTNALISLEENNQLYYPTSIQRFKINATPKFPIRTFATASSFTQNYLLPQTSYYAVKDVSTNNYVIDFDTLYTKISTDGYHSYLDIYMGGLEPERYYSILIKTIINGSTVIFDENLIFKVSN